MFLNFLNWELPSYISFRWVVCSEGCVLIALPIVMLGKAVTFKVTATRTSNPLWSLIPAEQPQWESLVHIPYKFMRNRVLLEACKCELITYSNPSRGTFVPYAGVSKTNIASFFRVKLCIVRESKQWGQWTRKCYQNGKISKKIKTRVPKYVKHLVIPGFWILGVDRTLMTSLATLTAT
jgi:hypothetical protein